MSKSCSLSQNLSLKNTRTWNANDDRCGICYMPFEACCPDCTYPGDDCTVVWGKCTHTFHMHCIMKWLQSQQTNKQNCPVCRQGWGFREE